MRLRHGFLYYSSAFHDELHLLQHCEVGQWIAVDCDQVSILPGFDGAPFVLSVQ